MEARQSARGAYAIGLLTRGRVMAEQGQSWKSETALTAGGLAESSCPAAEQGLAGNKQAIHHQAAVFDHNLMLYRTAPSHHGRG